MSTFEYQAEPTFIESNFQEPWPPPGYFSNGAFEAPSGPPLRICSPLEDRVRVDRDGSRHLSYQAPVLPIDTRYPFFVSGYLQADYANGVLLDQNRNAVGTLNVATGIFDINLDKSPGPNTRFVSYWSNGKLVDSPPDAEALRFPG